MYGDPLAPRTWMNDFAKNLIQFGLQQSPHEPTVYFMQGLLVIVFVDDIMYAGEPTKLNKLEKHVQQKYEGSFQLPLTDYLGFEIEKINNNLHLSQRKYITKAMEEHNVVSRRVSSPLPGTLLVKDLEKGTLLENKKEYQALMGSLNFVSLGTRPDVTFAVNLLARYQQTPTKETLSLAKRVLQYLNSTIQLTLPMKPNFF